MFPLEGKNKLGLISSFVYFSLIFIYQLVYFSVLIKGLDFYVSVSYVVKYKIAPAIALLVVISLAKDFFKDKSVITLFIGLFIFIGFSMSYFWPLEYSDILIMVFTIGCILLMSIRLIKSPNIGKIVGFIGILFIIAYLVDFIGVYFGNVYIDGLWRAILSVIPSGIFFSYFLFYEKA